MDLSIGVARPLLVLKYLCQVTVGHCSANGYLGTVKNLPGLIAVVVNLRGGYKSRQCRPDRKASRADSKFGWQVRLYL